MSAANVLVLSYVPHRYDGVECLGCGAQLADLDPDSDVRLDSCGTPRPTLRRMGDVIGSCAQCGQPIRVTLSGLACGCRS